MSDSFVGINAGDSGGVTAPLSQDAFEGVARTDAAREIVEDLLGRCSDDERETLMRRGAGLLEIVQVSDSSKISPSLFGVLAKISPETIEHLNLQSK